MSEARPRKAPACPICGRPAQPEVKPFCSPRCADVDLGRWLGERYVIPGPEEEGAPGRDDEPGLRGKG